jgi:hypothetical protein
MAATTEGEWACERCTYLNTPACVQCVMCEWEDETMHTVGARHRMPTTAPLALPFIGAGAVTLPSQPRGAVSRAQDATQSTPGLRRYQGVVVQGSGHASAREVSLMGLVGSIATPAKFIFNGASRPSLSPTQGRTRKEESRAPSTLCFWHFCFSTRN